MPDEPGPRRHFGRPGGRRRGCGFPVAEWPAPFDVAAGMLPRSTTAPLRTHDRSRAGRSTDGLEPGDVALGDRGSCSYAHLALLLGRGLQAAFFRVHQMRIVDFTPGRPRARRGRHAGPAGLPGSRRVLAHGAMDRAVVRSRPRSRPRRMSAEEFAALPPGIAVRELRYRVEAPG